MSVNEKMTAIADAIRAKTGGTGTLTLDQMPAAITSITSAPNLQSKSVTYTANGTDTITPDAGYDGLSSVDVEVNVSGGGGNSIVNTVTVEGADFTIEIDNASCNEWTLKYGNVFIITPNATPSLTFHNCLFEECSIYCRQAVKDAIVNGENHVVNCGWTVNG